MAIPKTKDFNTGDNHGCGYFQVTQKDGFRCSTAVGYLNPIKNRNNLEIITNAHVKKINFENQLVNPTNPYSASKAAAEILINSYKYTYKKEIIIVRANNIYGIRQYPEKLISTSIVNLINNEPIQKINYFFHTKFQSN